MKPANNSMQRTALRAAADAERWAAAQKSRLGRDRGMGFFSRKSDVESRLEEHFTKLIVASGASPREAQAMARGLLEKAKAEAKAEGFSPPPNSGDLLLRRSQEDPKTRETIEKKRGEGVRDEDIRWWWNMHDLERRMLTGLDTAWRLDAFINLKEQGHSQDQAAQRVRSSFPIYGDPSDTTHTSGNDRPLPWELKDRVDSWVQRFASHPQEMHERIARSSSMNAIIREEMRARKL